MRAFITMAFVVQILGCGYQTTSLPTETANSGTGVGTGTSGPDFASVKSKVFSVYCLRCHSQAGGNKGGINLENYATVRSYLDRIKTAVNGGFMPPSQPLPSTALKYLNDWIQIGAPEFPSSENPPPPETPSPPTPPPCDEDEQNNEIKQAFRRDQDEDCHFRK